MRNLRANLTGVRFSLIVFVLSLVLGGCVSTQPVMANQAPEQSEEFYIEDNHDPFEKINRSIFGFNTNLDQIILKPVASAYADHVPDPMRKSVRNFFSNLWEPTTLVNELLQGKPAEAGKTTARFLVNTTFGVLGLFDAATPMGLIKLDEDFGQTLAVWGVEDGPYLMLPFLGPSNLRDLGGLIIQFTTTDLVPPIFDNPEQLFASGLRLLDTRASLLGLDETLQLQVDPYLFLRESYRQSRLVQINDGVLPASEEEDAFEAELFGDD